MSFTDTLAQIKTGLWAIEPNFAFGLKDTVLNILAKNPTEAFKKETLEAKHYLMDANGNKFNSNSIADATPGTIGVIHITGPMIKYGNYYCWGADELMAMADKFEKSPNIIGHLWINDSGGGAVNAVAPYINFQLRRKKPLVSLCDMSGSANYWAIVPSDYIMAENNISSAFGSIGIMATLRNTKKYWEEMGVVDYTIYADQSDHKNESFDLAVEGKFELIKKKHLNPLAINFQNQVKSSRPNLKLDVEGIISGQVFYAEEAVQIGLADGIGNLELAIKKVTELAEVQNAVQNIMLN
jgi:protease-4